MWVFLKLSMPHASNSSFACHSNLHFDSPLTKHRTNTVHRFQPSSAGWPRPLRQRPHWPATGLAGRLVQPAGRRSKRIMQRGARFCTTRQQQRRQHVLVMADGVVQSPDQNVPRCSARRA